MIIQWVFVAGRWMCVIQVVSGYFTHNIKTGPRQTFHRIIMLYYNS